MLNLFSLRGLPWSGADGQEKVHILSSLNFSVWFYRCSDLSYHQNFYFHRQVQLTAAELESLRSELADIEEREAHLKAQ